MPISRRHKCIFVHIPKTGGTSVERALGIFADWRQENREMMFGRIASESIRAHGFLSHFLQHLTLRQIRALVPREAVRGFLSFAVVRNPWDRMVSIYTNPDAHMVITAREAGIALEGLGFADFIRAVDAVAHIHLLSQSEFVCDEGGRVLVDRVLRFETLAADFAKLCKEVSVETALGHHNRSKRSAYRTYYDEESRRAVAAKYRRDIDLFGYTF